MNFFTLSILAVLPGSIAALFERAGAPMRLAERHHSHHDTYLVPPDFLRSLAVAMLLVGCLGVLLGTFCGVGLFDSDMICVLAFTDTFTWMALVMWLMMARYKVSLFEDRGVIVPLVGRSICFFYSDIASIRWSGPRRASGYRDLVITDIDGRRYKIKGIIDIEQVLLHVDRFDVLESLGVGGPDFSEMKRKPWQPFARDSRAKKEKEEQVD